MTESGCARTGGRINRDARPAGLFSGGRTYIALESAGLPRLAEASGKIGALPMRIWVVDAFTDRVFAGNPAAVAPLDHWLPDATLQAIASENRFSETAFFVPTDIKGNYQLRWFTPLTEVPLCGHATLAAGAVVLSELESDLEVVVFDSQAGALVVRKTKDGYTLDLPRKQRAPWTVPADLAEALGRPRIVDAFVAEYANIVLDAEASVRALRPDLAAIDRIVRGPRQGCLAVTAPGDEGRPYDFVSRFFAPGVGLPEDPVTGSAFADLAPYWCDRFDMESVVGFQASKRGGYTRAVQTLSSVRLLGQVAIYLRGELDPSIERLHNRPTSEPDPLPRAKPRRKTAVAPGLDRAPIFEDPKIVDHGDVERPVEPFADPAPDALEDETIAHAAQSAECEGVCGAEESEVDVASPRRGAFELLAEASGVESAAETERRPPLAVGDSGG
jgi:PhzF family phenazine biosynthesis protein